MTLHVVILWWSSHKLVFSTYYAMDILYVFPVTLCHIVPCIRRMVSLCSSSTIMAHQVAMQAAGELRKGPWLEEEDERLMAVISVLGEKRWDALAKASGLKRSGKSCRLRWMNYLRPNLKHGRITAEEGHLIVELHKQFGNRWSRIARRLPGRTDNEIKNYWRSHLRKKALTLEQEHFNSSLNNGQQNSSVSMHEAASPCSSNEEWNSEKVDNLETFAESSDAFDLSRFELSFSSPYETRLTDWMSNWSRGEQSDPEQNVNCCETDHFSYWPPQWISGNSDNDANIWDGSVSLWDMD